MQEAGQAKQGAQFEKPAVGTAGLHPAVVLQQKVLQFDVPQGHPLAVAEVNAQDELLEEPTRDILLHCSNAQAESVPRFETHCSSTWALLQRSSADGQGVGPEKKGVRSRPAEGGAENWLEGCVEAG